MVARILSRDYLFVRNRYRMLKYLIVKTHCCEGSGHVDEVVGTEICFQAEEIESCCQLKKVRLRGFCIALPSSLVL